MAEIYVSTDVETDGPIPGPHSLLSLGSAAITVEGEVVDTFAVNLETLEGAAPHPATAAWWQGQPEAWAAARRDPRPVATAMADYVAWLDALPGKPVFVGYPAAFDFLFVYWYLIRFTGRSPFSFSALDIKTLAMARLGTPYRQAVKKRLPEALRPARRHTHRALDDALEQGELFVKLLRWEGPEG